MRTRIASLFLLISLSACVELDGDENEPLDSTTSGLTDIMGNLKQNNFSTSFTAIADFCAAAELCQVADFSGDGRADLAAIDPVNHRIRFARNLGLGLSFEVTTQNLPGVIFSRQDYAWGKADDDARADLFVCDQVSGRASVLRMATTSTLDPVARLVATGFCAAGDQFRVGDVDGSGHADAVRFRMNAAGDLRGNVDVALGNGDLTFHAPTRWHDFFGINNEQVQVADLDGNGKDDVVTCLPDAGAFVAFSDGVGAFLRSRRPLLGFAPAASSAPLVDFMAAGQTCLTGDFDGGGKADLVDFFGGTGGMIDDFRDSRGDVVVALSHVQLDFTDAYRLGRPRIRHENFCGAGEVCGVGDLNGDGKDDLVAFAHGAAGSTSVHVSFSQFGNPRSWSLDLLDIGAHVTEGSGDKPLILALTFRSTVGVRGSTVITRNAYNEDFATGIVAGGPRITIPAPVGHAALGSVRLRSFDNLMNRQPLEIFGTVVVVMEKDLSAAAAYSGLLDEATRALTTVLQNHVESRTLISFLTGGLGISMDSLKSELSSNMNSAIDDLMHLYITGLFDPDDYINIHIAVFPALDKELVGMVGAGGDPHVSAGVPGEGFFGVALGTMPFPDEDSPLSYEIRAIFR